MQNNDLVTIPNAYIIPRECILDPRPINSPSKPYHYAFLICELNVVGLGWWLGLGLGSYCGEELSY